MKVARQYNMEVKKVHALVEQSLRLRFVKPIGVQFFTIGTGRGKTTGFIHAIPKILKDRPNARILILTKEIKGIEEVLKTFRETEGLRNVVGFSGAHDVKGSHGGRSSGISVHRRVSRKYAAKAQVLVLTHAAATEAHRKGNLWMGKRDLVIVDEYPEPVDSKTVSTSMFQQAVEEERCESTREVLEEALSWARGQERQEERELSKTPTSAWIDQIRAVQEFSGECGYIIKQLAEHIRAGRVFQFQRSAHVTFTWVNFDLPFEDTSIIFSATAKYEGWQLDPCSANPIMDDFDKTDYSNLEFDLREWPEDLTNMNNKMASGASNRAILFAEIDGLLEEADKDEDVFLLMPKAVKVEYCETKPFNENGIWNDGKRTVYLQHWGRGIGSNDYKDCGTAILISEFHPNRNDLIARYAAHSRGGISDKVLKVGSNVKSSEFVEIKENHYFRHGAQMIARIQCRNLVEGTLKAKGAKVLWLSSSVARCQKIAAECFPQSVTNVPEVVKVQAKTKLIDRAFIALCNYKEAGEVTEVTMQMLKDDHSINLVRKSKDIAHAKELLAGAGWRFVKGGGRGKPSKFILEGGAS